MLRFIRRLVLAVIAAWPAMAIAQYFPSATRHTDGERFLTLVEADIHTEPSATASAPLSVPKGRLLYALPSASPDWLELVAYGSDIHPRPARLGTRIDLIEAHGGRFVLPQLLDGNRYIFHSGFVQRAQLVSLEKALPLPAATRAVRPVPSVWRDVGIEDRRFVPANPAAMPFAAVVRIQIERDTGTQSIPIAGCSGFFIESLQLVGSAGHCVSRLVGNDSAQTARGVRYVAIIHSGTAAEEQVPMQLESFLDTTRGDASGRIRRDLVDGADWALFRLAQAPRSKTIRPFYFPTADEWLRAGRIEALNLGFAGDLTAIKRRHFGGEVVHGEHCDVPLPLLSYRVALDGSSRLDTETVGIGCNASRGDSGGPLVIWNERRKRYEVIGITSYGRALRAEEFGPEAQRLFLQHSARLVQQYGPLPQGPGINGHGVSAFVPALRPESASKWHLDTYMVRAVMEKLGRRFDTTAYFQQFQQPGLAIRVDAAIPKE